MHLTPLGVEEIEKRSLGNLDATNLESYRRHHLWLLGVTLQHSGPMSSRAMGGYTGLLCHADAMLPGSFLVSI